jgi:Sulfatase
MRNALIVCIVCAVFSAAAARAEPRTRNVVLVTLDGVRTQEIFGGMDDAIAKHSAEQMYSDIETGRQRYWADTPELRRKRLMPFFWGALVPSGMLFGNADAGSHMLVRNSVKWSSPGYAEILTGEPQPDVVDNSLRRYPARTVLEYIETAKKLGKTQVAEIGSWDGFGYAAASRDGAFVMNSGYEAFPKETSTPGIDELVGLRRDVMELWDESSNDAITYRIAKQYLRAYRPRLLWIGYSQSDDWAHADRYDRVLDYLHLADRLIEDLWNTLQSLPAYKDQTTLIVTTDHGRGLTPTDWQEHDETIPGSEAIWLAVIGPDTPALGDHVPAGTVHQSDIAATIVELFGLEPAAFNPDAGPPLPQVVSAE